MKVKPLNWEILHTGSRSMSALTDDRKPKYFAMELQDGGYRVYGIDGINDGGTDYPEANEEDIKKIINEDWEKVVFSYIY